MYKSKLVSIKEFIKILNNLSPNYQVRVYHKKKERPTPHSGDDTVKKKTLSQRLDELTEIVTNGFKQVNTRLDLVEKRLDYNNLKKLPESNK